MAQYVQSKTATFLDAGQWRTPTHLLLVLEWIFLTGAILINILLPLPGQFPTAIPNWSPFPFWQVLTVGIFGIIGLKRPNQRWDLKVFYTIAEFGIVYIPILLDPHLSYIFPPLHLIIVIRSCSMFKKFGQLVTTVCANILFFISLSSQQTGTMLSRSGIEVHMKTAIRLNAVFAFLLISIFILLLVNALFFVQRSRQELAYAHDRLRQYALRIEDQAMLQERNRIAHEMHDALGHVLTAQSLQLATVQHFWNSDPDKANQALSQAKRLGSQALNELRQAVSTLRADSLQGLSLEDAIAKLIHTFHQATGVLPSCTLRLDRVPPKNMRLCIYRLVQEALTNIAKHSHATDVSIYLQTTPKQLNILIQDNGIGFNPTQNISGFGLQGMQERTLALDGLFSIVSQPGLGCKIMAQIPFAE
jgi:signal transduction histidine kinase